MNQLQAFFIHKESQTLNPNGKELILFFRNPGDKYGFHVIYKTTNSGFFIGLDYEWPEAPDDENVLKSSMITDYQFKKFNYGSSGNQKEHTVFLLISKYRDYFYTNLVIFDDNGLIKKAELIQFESKETLLEFADNQLWVEFSNEVNRFLGREVMKEYSVKIIGTVSISTEVSVQASSKEEAERKAKDRVDAINALLVDARNSDVEFIEVHQVKEFI